MKNEYLLLAALAARCRTMILESTKPELNLPKPVRPAHLAWMCRSIEQNAENWPASKLHRWIGFVQSAMIANRRLDLDEAKRMFDEAKAAHGETSEDLLDHLDPESSFEFDIGGEG